MAISAPDNKVCHGGKCVPRCGIRRVFLRAGSGLRQRERLVSGPGVRRQDLPGRRDLRCRSVQGAVRRHQVPRAPGVPARRLRRSLSRQDVPRSSGLRQGHVSAGVHLHAVLGGDRVQRASGLCVEPGCGGTRPARPARSARPAQCVDACAGAICPPRAALCVRSVCSGGRRRIERRRRGSGGIGIGGMSASRVRVEPTPGSGPTAGGANNAASKAKPSDRRVRLYHCERAPPIALVAGRARSFALDPATAKRTPT